MDEEYDYIILGTGLTECILSGVLSVEKKKVLHMDRHEYYGGECASLNLTQLYKRFRSGMNPPSQLGKDRDYNIDLVPKFMMAGGELVQILIHTDVTRYLEFKQIGGSYVFRDGRISKVPATESEALRSPLMGLFEKRRLKKFLEFALNYDEKNPATQQGVNIHVVSTIEVYKKFGLEQGTQDFVGHALALYSNDNYLQKPFKEARERIKLYNESMMRYGTSPYLYPLYGLGELPQAFARLSAVYGGTYMLNKPIDKIVYDENGIAVGVTSENETARCKAIIGDPSYFPHKVRRVGRVIRCICILRHPIPNTAEVDSVQIIIPQSQVGRRHDIYISCVSASHNICAQGCYVAMISTEAETDHPENEIKPALALLGPIEDRFIEVKDLLEPIDDGKKDQIFVSKSYDASSHFESVCDDVKAIYKRVTGMELKLETKEFPRVDEFGQ